MEELATGRPTRAEFAREQARCCVVCRMRIGSLSNTVFADRIVVLVTHHTVETVPGGHLLHALDRSASDSRQLA